jgi:hypothetical protein
MVVLLCRRSNLPVLQAILMPMPLVDVTFALTPLIPSITVSTIIAINNLKTYGAALVVVLP